MAIFTYQYIQNAIIASLLASIISGIIGVLVVEKKLMMMSGGIAHTSYGGVGFGYLMGFEPIIGAFLIAIIAALSLGFIKRRNLSQLDMVVGLFWSLGMGLGILFISLMPGYPPDMSSYLFGNILAITKADLTLMAALTAIITVSMLAFFNYWKSYMFDEEFVSVMGIRIAFFDYLTFIIIALAVVVMIRVVGIILILALFTAPTAIAEFMTNSLKSRILASIGISLALCFSGLAISYMLNIATGATIVILSVISYLAVYLIQFMINKSKRTNSLLR